jgi:hypothetical protein
MARRMVSETLIPSAVTTSGVTEILTPDKAASVVLAEERREESLLMLLMERGVTVPKQVLLICRSRFEGSRFAERWIAGSRFVERERCILECGCCCCLSDALLSSVAIRDGESLISDFQNDRYLRATCRFRTISKMLCKARLALRETLAILAHDSDKVSNISPFKENHFHFVFNRVIMPYNDFFTLYSLDFVSNSIPKNTIFTKKPPQHTARAANKKSIETSLLNVALFHIVHIIHT